MKQFVKQFVLVLGLVIFGAFGMGVVAGAVTDPEDFQDFIRRKKVEEATKNGDWTGVLDNANPDEIGEIFGLEEDVMDQLLSEEQMDLFGITQLIGGAAIQVTVVLAEQYMHLSSPEGEYAWPVSTAKRGKITPRGCYRPTFLSKYHRSSLYNNAPMPYAVFFRGNYAVHGTKEIKNLGRPASNGCVRLHPKNAAVLFDLVQRYGKGRTSICVI